MTGGQGRQVLTFRTNVGDVVEAGPEHRLRFAIAWRESRTEALSACPGQLEALVSRPVMYDLVELGETIEVDGQAMFCSPLGRRTFPDHAGRRAGCAFPMNDAITQRYPLFSAADFRRRALNQNGGPVDHAWRDHGDHHPQSRYRHRGRDLASCATPPCWSPVVDDGEEAHVIFTKRTATLRKHSGQIAFPGG